MYYSGYESVPQKQQQHTEDEVCHHCRNKGQIVTASIRGDRKREL